MSSILNTQLLSGPETQTIFWSCAVATQNLRVLKEKKEKVPIV